LPRRSLLAERQRTRLFDLPTDAVSLLKHYTLADDDIEHVRERRRPENQLGFALQLCAFRFPGRLLKAGEVIPEDVSRFIAAQLDLKPDDLLPYAVREETRREHLVVLRRIYGYRMFKGKHVRRMKSWLAEQAEAAGSGEDRVQGFVEECRRRLVILSAMSTIERLCADTRIAARLDGRMRTRRDSLLSESADGHTSRFIWVRQVPGGEQLGRCQPPARAARTPAGTGPALRDSRWRAAIADTVVETHDRIVGRISCEAKRRADLRVEEVHTDIQDTLGSFRGLANALMEAKSAGSALEDRGRGFLRMGPP